MRLEGFGASGMDTDQVVQSLMAAERMPLSKIEQDKQLVEWKIEEYREVISEVNDFRSEFFDVLNRDNYMLSDRVFNSFTTKSENSGVVTINATSDAMSGSHEVNVEQLATQARATSGDGISKNVTGSNVASFNFSEEGESFTLILDGESRTITLDDSVDSLEKVQESIDARFGEGKVEVQENDGKISFVAVEESGVNRIDVRDATGGGALETLGFDGSSNYSNRLGRFDTLGVLADKFAFEGSLFDGDDNVSFTINDVDFSFDSDTRMSDMINEINNSEANVTMRYNELSDKFEIVSDISGAGKTIEFSEEGSNFFEAININGEENIVFGQDAKATIDGQEVTRSNNTFSVSGVNFTLNGESVGDETTTVSVNRDTDAVFDKITNFVGAYNDLIEGINERISQRRDRDYAPLTQEQRDQMSEDEIENWEERAKQGLISRDPILSSMVNNIRSALFNNIEGVDGGLHSIGISTGTFEQRGKLIIDEDELRESIQNNPNEVRDIFIAGSRDSSSNEQGVARRIESIIQDNVRTTRNDAGRKGRLLERAGMEGDSSFTNNVLFRRLQNFDRQITRFTERLEKREEEHYQRFARFESAMFKMMEQGESLLAQL